MGNENTKFSGRASRGIILNLVLAGGNEISEILAAVTTSRVSGLSIADTLTSRCCYMTLLFHHPLYFN